MIIIEVQHRDVSDISVFNIYPQLWDKSLLLLNHPLLLLCYRRPKKQIQLLRTSKSDMLGILPILYLCTEVHLQPFMSVVILIWVLAKSLNSSGWAQICSPPFSAFQSAAIIDLVNKPGFQWFFLQTYFLLLNILENILQSYASVIDVLLVFFLDWNCYLHHRNTRICGQKSCDSWLYIEISIHGEGFMTLKIRTCK